MNPRDRTIAYAVLAAVMLGAGAFLFNQLYLAPLHEGQDTVRRSQEKLDNLDLRIEKVKNQQAQLQEWRKLSLPKDMDQCTHLYGEYLRHLMASSGFAVADYKVKCDETSSNIRTPFLPNSAKPNETPVYTPLNFTMTGKADLFSVVKLLEQFYRTPLLHKITSLRFKRHNAKTRDVEIELKVEAIIVSDAEDRPQLLPAGKVAINNLARQDYAGIVAKNPFYGPPPPAAKPDDGPDPINAVKLTSITKTEQGWQALLHNTADDHNWCIRPQEGYVLFHVTNKRRVLRLIGEVVHIDFSNIVFYAAGKYYRMALDQTLAEAMRTPLTEAQVRALGQTQGTGERSDSPPSSFVEGRPREFPGVRRISTP